MRSTTADLFPPAETMPAGFDYRPQIIDRAEEAALVAEFASLEFAPYEFRGVQARRRVVAFGYHNDYRTRRLEPSPDIPAFLLGLRDNVAEFANCLAEDFEQALVSEYTPGTPIGWHLDRAHYNNIVGVSLLSPATLRLRRREGNRWQRSSQILEPRSAYILSGAVRALWQHSIPAVSELRYSITFRTMAKRPMSGSS
jgi:alkylated DNA repair dioxygenase AlkB